MIESPAKEINLKHKLRATFCFILFFSGAFVFGETALPEKKITDYFQSWFSINNTLRFTNHWGMVGDLHIRRDNFLKDDYFYFLRAGAIYYISGKYPVILGVAHLWQAPPAGKNTWGNENRIYEQWSGTQKEGITSILNRVRIEQRWRDQLVNDQVVGNKLFTLRIRYLASFEIRPFKNPMIPGVVISDEACIQFGESIVYNTFDQNRVFLGLKQSLSQKLSFDIGYMNIFQQKSTGNQYTSSHDFRLFFYYNVDFRRNREKPN